MVFRVYVEKKGIHAVEALKVFNDLKTNLQIEKLSGVRILNRYDVEGIDEEIFMLAKDTVFSEPQVDYVYDSIPDVDGALIFASEYLPGQFDQRADSCAQCIQLLTQGERPMVRTAKIYILENADEADLDKIEKYLINPVEARLADFEQPQTLDQDFTVPSEVEILAGFTELNRDGLLSFIKSRGLAMDIDDIEFLQDYFKREEKRNPTITEIRMIDSYWSDHCRHTTFSTSIENVFIDEPAVQSEFEKYLANRGEYYGEKAKDRPVTLMDLATFGAKYLKKKGILKNLDESDEINACSVKVKANVDGQEQDWIMMFKNETHNHPTEIEPFGGAATCLGGAIRDPLSGRSYVYQAMRVTGAADPTKPVSETLPGKLPQSKLTVGAANGYSSYGNQIGLATGGVYEIYHEGYVAKRLEIGAVVGAAPADHIRRSEPAPGDIVLLLGGRTGRDGCGGATGSSKAHTAKSISTCGAEVQKGNPPEERKLQRLFRNKEAANLIKRCNDFGAGGISVAIGELADGLHINLSAVKKKYEGLDGTELAISESQERMAVVVDKNSVARFCELALAENLECTVVAQVMPQKRLVMEWNGKKIVDISRNFLNSNGAKKYADVAVPKYEKSKLFDSLKDKVDGDFEQTMKNLLSDLNICSQKGLVERFDSTIGASSVVLPYGGKLQKSPSQFMAAKFPTDNGNCTTVSTMAYGFNPFVSEMSPFHGAYYAVLESITKLIAAGVKLENIYLTLQEYFERTKEDPLRWGKPFAALLGALKAQLDFGVGAIGGKDSMSGTFENIDVPPTLVSFAVAAAHAKDIITNEFKKPQSKVYLLKPEYNSDMLVDKDKALSLFSYVSRLIDEGKVYSARAVGHGGVLEAIYKLSIGNDIGFEYECALSLQQLITSTYGAIIVETDTDIDGIYLGKTISSQCLIYDNQSVDLSILEHFYVNPLENVFPTRVPLPENTLVENFCCKKRERCVSLEKFARPRVLIPVFPGTNCEYDTAARFNAAGAQSEILVIKNITKEALSQSIDAFVEIINQSQILMLPGGFSGGDEPDGSGKFITGVLRNPRVMYAVNKLVKERDGLVLGICNGFQALVKCGLLPYGEITEKCLPTDPTLTFNAIGRHQSMMVNTRIASVKSPWLAGVSQGDIHTIAISHGEGRFFADEQMLKTLVENNQIATQYVDMDGNATLEMPFNPNLSALAIEGITSPDGRIFGKMGHSERQGVYVAKNVPGNKDQKIFESGVAYFR